MTRHIGTLELEAAGTAAPSISPLPGGEGGRDGPSRRGPGRLAALLLAALIPAAPGSAADEPPERYRAAVLALDAYVAAEVAGQSLPALSIALVDDQSVVWSKGYGLANPETGRPATPETVYRVGSVSKLFTDVAVMQLVEQGKLDLDAPARLALPEFAPKGAEDPPITLRMMMAHRSGLVREPPIGSYFDATSPSIEETVGSLSGVAPTYRPGTRLKYSNAAIAAVGLALEKLEKRPFAEVVRRRVLDPLGMTHSDFVPGPGVVKDLASATMWTEHGREFPAPTFELGIAPAGSLYSTAGDLAKFLQAIFAGGKGPNGPILTPSTLESMMKVQFADGPAASRGFGLGFSVGRFQGLRRVGHGGAVYGFATELAALPDEKLGVVVIASRDCANGSTTRIGDAALAQMLAARKGNPPPTIAVPTAIPPETARRWAGRYGSGGKTIELAERAGRLRLRPSGGGPTVELRASGADLVGEDAITTGPRLVLEGDKVRIGDDVYERLPSQAPPPAPADRFLGLIGEYGWDHNTLYVLEREGRLFALIEWFFAYPLREESKDVYAFPDAGGLYHGEKLAFRRDASGRATVVEAAGVAFPRRALDGEDGRTFRIRPLRPVAEIRREVAGLAPPEPPADLRVPDLVDLAALVPGVKLEVRYATADNFLGEPVYTSARALMQRPAAEALARVQARLAPMGYGLLIHDAYRPWKVTKIFWEATPPSQRTFVADPSKGSKHNRGCAVDLTLRDLATGRAVEMVGGYDEFSDRSYPDYPGGTSRQRWHRDLLRGVMESEGFSVNEAEWWHFDYRDWREYPVLDLPFEALGK